MILITPQYDPDQVDLYMECVLYHANKHCNVKFQIFSVHMIYNQTSPKLVMPLDLLQKCDMKVGSYRPLQ